VTGARGKHRFAWTLAMGRGLETPSAPEGRGTIIVAMIVVAVAFLALFLRLWYLQILRGEQFRDKSEHNRVRSVDVAPFRGLILDAKGRRLAENVPTFTLAVVPEDVEDWDRLARRLKQLVDLDPAELDKARRAARGVTRFKPVRLLYHLTRKQLALLETFRYELPGVKLLVDYRRNYLAALETAHVIGYLGQINKRELKSAAAGLYRMGDYVGRDGLERSRESVLHGRRGVRRVEVNARGRELALLAEVPPVPGHDITLSIDLDLQRAAAAALKGRVGGVAAINPQNGQVYCLYSSPSYDQNSFITGMSSAQWNKITKDPLHPLKNRAISGLYPPGSTFKIVTAAAGLAEGVITPQTTFFCGGEIKLGRRTYKCWAHKHGGHGAVDLKKALRESCDIYFYKVGQRLGVDRLAKYARAFGLGSPSGVSLPHESGGLVPTSAWKKRRFGEKWQEGETLSVAIGQGFNLVTPLQLARMVAVIANGGRLVTPSLVKQVSAADGAAPVPEVPGVTTRVPVKPAHLKAIHQGLLAVVNEPHGTARRAALDGITVAGKTGTSQVVSLKIEKAYGSDKKIPWKYRSHALFVCYAPAENPVIAIGVVVEHGGHGGSDAAPVAKKIMEAFFASRRQTTAPKPPAPNHGATP